jgi:NTE family protein
MNGITGRTKQAIGLALSGGGVRAAVFHAGVLRYLAEQKLLEQIVHISSVSGGSLFTGLVYRLTDYHWPNSEICLTSVLPQIRQELTSKSLQYSAICRLLFNPINWHYCLSRANVLAQAIRGIWDIKASLGELDTNPVWTINCTTAEDGHRFRFKNNTMGDYELGYTNAGTFDLAKAIAISAAFPGGIGPLTVRADNLPWMKSKDWKAYVPERYDFPYKALHLYDGGLYDNLGLEPLFDTARQRIKKDDTLSSNIDFLLVSDAGAPLARQSIPHPLNPFRFKRIADITMDQCRALRIRPFINFLQNNPASGAYAGIGTDAKVAIGKYAKDKKDIANSLLEQTWLSPEDTRLAATYNTTLGKLSPSIFDIIERHGYETAKWNIELMCKTDPATEVPTVVSDGGKGLRARLLE